MVMKVSKTSILTDLCKAKSIEEIDALIKHSSNVLLSLNPCTPPPTTDTHRRLWDVGFLGGGGALVIMDSTGRLRLKGLPFQAWRYIKG